jgi:predicted outer membrane repeat protein
VKNSETSSLISSIENTCFVVCSAEEYGGAIYISINTEINNCFFDRCVVVGNNEWTEGGAIYIKDASVNISGCTFACCKSSIGGGGGISFSGGGELRIIDTSFLSCITYGIIEGSVGGSIRIDESRMYGKNCTFLNGWSNYEGGGIGEVESTVEANDFIELEDCIFLSNYANLRGGAISLNKISLKCRRCMFLHNEAKSFGSVVSGNLKFEYLFIDCVFVENVINCADVLDGVEGGAIYGNVIKESDNVVGSLKFTNVIFVESKILGDCSSDGIILFYE